MKIIMHDNANYPGKDINQKAFLFLLDVEVLFNKHLDTDEGIGDFCDVWFVLPKKLSLCEMLENILVSFVSRPSEYTPHSLIIFKSNLSDNYYGFYNKTHYEKDVRFEHICVNSINRSMHKALDYFTNNIKTQLVE